MCLHASVCISLICSCSDAGEFPGVEERVNEEANQYAAGTFIYRSELKRACVVILCMIVCNVLVCFFTRHVYYPEHYSRTRQLTHNVDYSHKKLLTQYYSHHTTHTRRRVSLGSRDTVGYTVPTIHSNSYTDCGPASREQCRQCLDLEAASTIFYSITTRTQLA